MAEALANTGSQMQVENDRDMMRFNIKSLSNPSALEPSMALYISQMTEPGFKAIDFTHNQQEQIQSIQQKQESPDSVATDLFFNAVYGQHPYAHPILGTENTVQKITLDNVKSFYRSNISASNASIAIVGDINLNKAKEMAEKIDQSLPLGKQINTIIPATAQKPETIQHNFPSTQTVVMIGQLGIRHDNPNYFPLIVGNYVLGGGVLVSRLSEEVREKRGLTYGVYSQFIPLPGIGPFVISLSTQNSQKNEAITITKETLNKFLNEGPSEKEIIAAKNYITGSFPLSLASDIDIANLLLRMNFYHLPENYLDTYINQINAVKREDILKAFKDTLNPNSMQEIFVGKQ
jgi:zinc protease